MAQEVLFSVSMAKVQEALESNLEKHIKEFEEAKVGWVKKTLEAIDQYKEAITREDLKASCTKLSVLQVQRPIDKRLDYSRLLGVVKLARENGQESLEINEYRYDEIFNDNFEWVRQAKGTNSSYL